MLVLIIAGFTVILSPGCSMVEKITDTLKISSQNEQVDPQLVQALDKSLAAGGGKELWSQDLIIDSTVIASVYSSDGGHNLLRQNHRFVTRDGSRSQ